MQQRKFKIIFFYLTIFIIVGSVNNIQLNNLKLQEVKHIKVYGLDNYNNEIIKKKITKLELKNIFFLKKNEIKKIIDENSLVNNYEVFKQYPSTLDIKLEKTDLLAKINIKGETLVIGSNGKLLQNYLTDQSLPYIFGKPEILEFLKFKNDIDNSKVSYQKIKNIYFFNSRRWDIELHDNVLIKLSKINPTLSLNTAFTILNDKNFDNVKIIDLRVNNQIIINDKRI